MPPRAWTALLFSLLAGLSTSIGSLPALFAPRKGWAFLSVSLGFSAGVMILISIGDLMPAAAALLSRPGEGPAGGVRMVASTVIGMLLASGVDLLAPETAEPSRAAGAPSPPGTNGLRRIGSVSAAAIVLHNFPEGVATFMAGCHSTALGLPVALAVALHNIPEGIAVSVPVRFGTGSRARALLAATLSGLSEPLGALLAALVLAPVMSDALLGVLFGATAGIMLCLSFSELLPASRKYGPPGLSLAGVLAGVTVMSLGLLLIP